jgi:hypothetical protein
MVDLGVTLIHHLMIMGSTTGLSAILRMRTRDLEGDGEAHRAVAAQVPHAVHGQ